MLQKACGVRAEPSDGLATSLGARNVKPDADGIAPYVADAQIARIDKVLPQNGRPWSERKLRNLRRDYVTISGAAARVQPEFDTTVVCNPQRIPGISKGVEQRIDVSVQLARFVSRTQKCVASSLWLRQYRTDRSRLCRAYPSSKIHPNARSPSNE